MWSSFKHVLKSVSIVLAAGSGGAEAQTPAYADSWEAYLGERSGHPALILYNVGISDVLGGLPEQTLVTMTVAFKSGHIDGLPTPEEGKFLFQLDDVLGPTIADFAAHDLGRVSTQGERRVYVVAGENAQSLGEALVKAAGDLGYTAVLQMDANAVQDVYANVLKPTLDEKRVIADNSVLRQLADSGDVAMQVRQVNHWAYFPTREVADEFADWVRQNEFDNVEVEQNPDRRFPFLVKSSHSGTMLPEDILERTRFQDQKARDLGGEYDGWETAVMR